MKLLFISTAVLFLFSLANAQNIGIGITTPRAKLHVFNGASGNVTPYPPMVVESNMNTYVNLLTLDANETGVLFGNSTNAASGGIIYNNIATLNGLQFRTEGNQTRVVITRDGYVGIGQSAPTATLQVGRGTGIGGTAIFEGTTYASQFNSSTNEDTYIRAGKINRFVILNDIPGGRVGIGTSNPNAPLGFSSALGKKITLYPGASGDAGFAVQTNLLQIFAQGSSADIAFGFDQSGIFTERLRIKSNGALALNGNLGLSGQVLQSDGGWGTSWANPTNLLYSNTIMLQSTSPVLLNGSYVAVPGLSHSFTANSNTKVLINFAITAAPPSCFACGASTVYVDILIDGVLVKRHRQDVPNDSENTISGTWLISVAPGSHTVSFSATRTGPDVLLGPSGLPGAVTLQIIPQ